jgi:hypothetical protein
MLHGIDQEELALANMALLFCMLRIMIKVGATTRDNVQAMFEEAAGDLLRDQGGTSKPHLRAAEFLRWEAAQFL